MTALLLCCTAALAAEPHFDWTSTDHSLALKSGSQVVWQFNYCPMVKPCFHPLTVAGSPPLTDFRPHDHPWHRALWFSWKSINGLAYWDEDPQTGKSPGETEVAAVKATPSAGGDGSARFELSLCYHPPGKPPVLSEKRLIEVSPPAANGAYHIDWQSTFTAGQSEARLERTPISGQPQGVSWGGYAGLSLRLQPTLRNWQFVDSQGPVTARWKQARWMAFGGPLGSGKSATIAVLEHPASFRHPTPWYLIQEMPYFSPAVLYQSPYTLPAKTSLALKYRILIEPAGPDPAALEKKWQEFAAQKGP
jgi:hypothetical protein